MIGQRVIPFKVPGTGIKRIVIDVGSDAPMTLQATFSSSVETGIESDIIGWFNQEFDAADATKYASPSPANADYDANWDFMSGGLKFDVPSNTAFITLFAQAQGRGVIILEPKKD